MSLEYCLWFRVSEIFKAILSLHWAQFKAWLWEFWVNTVKKSKGPGQIKWFLTYLDQGETPSIVNHDHLQPRDSIFSEEWFLISSSWWKSARLICPIKLNLVHLKPNRHPATRCQPSWEKLHQVSNFSSNLLSESKRYKSYKRVFCEAPWIIIFLGLLGC